MTMAHHGRVAIEQLAARFVFDDKAPAEMQQDLARRIEAAIAEFKATQMQELIATTLRHALTDRIERAIDSWYRGQYFPQPIAQAKKAAAQEASP